MAWQKTLPMTEHLCFLARCDPRRWHRMERCTRVARPQPQLPGAPVLHARAPHGAG
jgi:hypothetical protein